MLEKEAHERRKKALGLLEEGAEMQGVVRTVVEWGAFVALPEAENLEGLVHVSEVSHDPRVKLAEILKPGDKFPVKITKIDDKGKIWLSRKALLEDPWGEAKQKYGTGSEHVGKATRVEKFGVFVQLDDEVEGLIHVSDLSFKRVEHPEDLVKVGDELKVVVRHFDFKNRKIALHPALKDKQAEEPRQKVARNAHVEAEVIRGESAGVHVRVLGVTGREARGFIPAGQTGNQRGTDLRKVFKPGQKLSLKVIDLDPRRGEPKLSLRGRKDDEERKAHREYRKQFTAEAKFGTLGDLLKAKLNLSGSEESGK
jgi:small subunit ribosomal protein S1